MIRKTSISYSITAALLTLYVFNSPVNAQTLSQVPLEGAIDVDPNIMINLDDSLSMYNAIREDGYDRNASYPVWTYGSDTGPGSSFFPDNIPVEALHSDGCPFGSSGPGTGQWVKGTKSGETVCLKLPDMSSGGTFDDTYYADHYLHYLFETHGINGQDSNLTGVLPNQERREVLKDAALEMVASTSGIRWCVSDLKNSNEDFITATCGSNTSTLNSAISGAGDDLEGGGTPLAESFFEITEYFRGIGNYTSPVQYRCQNNFAIVVTDGYPTNDAYNVGDIPSLSRAEFGLSGSETLPNWDGTDGSPPVSTVALFNSNSLPPYSDGFGGASQGQEGATLYLDDLAKFGFDIDMFRTGNDSAGGPWGDNTDPGDSSDFPWQHLRTYTIGFGIDNQMLDDAAEYGGGLSFSANNAAELAGSLDMILTDVAGIVGSSAASTATTAFLSSGDQVFQVKYETGQWNGSLISYTIDSDPESDTFGEVQGQLWNTDTSFVSNEGVPPTRNLLSVNSITGAAIPLTWGNLSTDQQAYLENSQDKFNYLLGDQTMEIDVGGPFRNRNKLLPDVVHASPVYVADRDFGYVDASYRTFYESTLVQNRDPVVYIGGNGGFIHGFNAPATSSGGTEAFSFMPQSVFPFLADLTNPSYEHHYFVDGTAVVVDSQLVDNSTLEWRSVLLGTFGAGVEGIFALDVTDPSKFTDLGLNGEDIFLWEISNKIPTASETSALVNLAPAATATQSSTESGGVATRAIDGTVNGVFANGGVTLTENETNAWLELELDALSYIEELVIYNRSDCCSNRLEDFSVFVSPAPFDSQDLTTTQNQDGVIEYFVEGEAGVNPNPTELAVNEVAKYVRIQLRDTNNLNIGELEVYGTVPQFPYMGHLIDRPSVIRVKQESVSEPEAWYGITGNGVHSAGDHAVFYQIALTTGELADSITLDDSGNNGIVSNTAIDLDGDDYVDRVYLTDIKGQIWRLDWDPENFVFVSYYTDGSGDPMPFFEATVTNPADPGNGVSQEFVSAVEVTRFQGDTDALLLYVGTGKYYDIEDAILGADEPKRSFYGILDRGDNTSFTTLNKTNLVAQTIGSGSVSGKTVRGVTGSDVDYTVKSGWYIDLPTNGERVINESIAIKGRILFTTIIPNPPEQTDPCVPQVTGWLMEVDAVTGLSPETVTFDANLDGDFDDQDVVVLGGETVHVAGIQPSSGAPLPPSIIRMEPGQGREGSIRGILSDTSGQLQEFTHEAPVARTSWIRLN